MLERIIYDPTHFGSPMIKDSGMSVQTILEFLLQEMTIRDIVTHYPPLTREDVLAAIYFAIETISPQKSHLAQIEPSTRVTLQKELLQIGQQCAALPILDDRSPEQILGYNELGVPV